MLSNYIEKYPTIETLEALLNESENMTQAARAFTGRDNIGSSEKARLAFFSLRVGITPANWTFPDYGKYLRVYDSAKDARSVSSYFPVAMIQNGKPYECAGIINGVKCASIVHMGHFLQLDVDHIDGNAANSTLSNLQFLCPNCHSLQLTSSSSLTAMYLESLLGKK